MILNWKVSPEDQALITRIADRANDLAGRLGLRGKRGYALRDAMMDITAAHANGRPLDLAGLLAAKDGDFAHDVFGIRRHIDRNTGQLMDCFVPRFALPTA
jgi:hypothetical protein